MVNLWWVIMKTRVDQIELLIAQNQLSAAQVFTQMKQLVERGAPCKYQCEAQAFKIEIRGLEHDKKRLDWLSDVKNCIGNVQLPTESVLNNPHSLRAAIDDAMQIVIPYEKGTGKTEVIGAFNE